VAISGNINGLKDCFALLAMTINIMQSFQRLTAMIFDVIQTFFPAIGLGSNIGL